MLHYFKANAPIRRKFDILTFILVIFAFSPAALIFMGWEAAWTGVFGHMGSAVAVAAVMQIAKRLICEPYISTVVRMEALAAGDVASPISHVDYQDCVGRISRAMEFFRETVTAREQADAVLQDVIAEVITALGHMRDGDLNYSIKIDPGVCEKANAISHAFNDANRHLAQVLVKVAETAGNVLNGATEIRSASNDLAVRTEQQANSLRDSAHAMAEVTQMVQQTATNAGEVGTQVADAHAAANDGGNVVQKAVEAMQEIQKSATEITNIIDVIDGIAFQTNLLALNAGVEAARAGDAGKGFAVVANEVRALAQRSADAAKNIKELITASTASVAEGVALVDETGTVLLKISDRVAAVNTRIAEISASVQVQANRLQQVNLAVGEMDKMTQQNAAMVEQSTAASRSLAEEANSLFLVVQQFSGEASANLRKQPTGSSPRRATPRSIPYVMGNLARQLEHDSESWSEF